MGGGALGKRGKWIQAEGVGLKRSEIQLQIRGATLTWQPSWLTHLLWTYSLSPSFRPAWYDSAARPAFCRLSAIESQSLRDKQ